MALAPKGSAPPIFDLKSASLPLVALVLKTADLDELSGELQSRLGDNPQFFSNDPVLIDLSAVRDVVEPSIDFAVLSELLRTYRMNPVAVSGGSVDQHACALQAGLAEASAESVPADSPRNAASKKQKLEVVREVVKEVIKEVPTPVPAIIVDKPLRSGQQVYAKGGDLVVLAVVNFGAELIADGSIHVYAPLRGKAIAGARGNTDARIYASCLEAELVSIAGIYRTAENPLPDDVRGKAAQILLRADKLVIEPLKL